MTIIQKARVASGALFALSLSACVGTGNYEKIVPGKFKGEAALVWQRPDTFLYSPAQQAGLVPLSYTTGKPYGKPGKPLTITPGPMFTTGASIPRLLWLSSEYSPWRYARAALIHDWLFEAKHRHGEGLKGYDWVEDLSVDDAADIFAEAIKAQMIDCSSRNRGLAAMKPRPNTVALMRWATSSSCWIPTAERLWETGRSDEKETREALDGLDRIRANDRIERVKILSDSGAASPGIRQQLKEAQALYQQYRRETGSAKAAREKLLDTKIRSMENAYDPQKAPDFN